MSVKQKTTELVAKARCKSLKQKTKAIVAGTPGASQVNKTTELVPSISKRVTSIGRS